MSGFLLNPYIAYAAGSYPFSSFTFTPAGATGRIGPSISQCLTAYNTAANPWLNDVSKFNVSSGIQLWTCPQSGMYRLLISGASSSYNAGWIGSSGAVFQLDVNLTAGQVYKILVGQMGGRYTTQSSGGGGGTFFTTSSNSPIAIAGGGGGTQTSSTAQDWVSAGTDPTSTTNGQAGTGTTPGAGGTSGNGGKGGGTSSWAAGGGGFYTAGTIPYNSANGGQPGIAFINGGTGGAGYNAAAFGGFGGGGGTHGNAGGGGGGGGYSGGGGGANTTGAVGGGGGSYASIAGAVWNSFHQGDGYLTITKL